MKISDVVTVLSELSAKHGDLPVVLFDLDSTNYFKLVREHIEVQRMPDATLRVSIGPNSWGDERVDYPAHRPVE
jgi:hypothetical protein